MVDSLMTRTITLTNNELLITNNGSPPSLVRPLHHKRHHPEPITAIINAFNTLLYPKSSKLKLRCHSHILGQASLGSSCSIFKITSSARLKKLLQIR